MPSELAYEFDLELAELCDLWDTVILENGQRAINSKPIRDSIETYGAVQTGAFYAKGQTPGFDLVGKYLGYEKDARGARR